MTTALNALVKRIRRRFPAAPFEYIAVWETHRNGYPHIHLIARAPFIPQRLLSRWWRELNGSPVVDVRAVTNANGATHYLTKYLTKRPTCPPGYRHFRTSRRFWDTPGGLFGRAASDGIRRHISRLTVYEKATFLQSLGYRVEYKGNGAFEAYPDFLVKPP